MDAGVVGVGNGTKMLSTMLTGSKVRSRWLGASCLFLCCQELVCFLSYKVWSHYVSNLLLLDGNIRATARCLGALSSTVSLVCPAVERLLLIRTPPSRSTFRGGGGGELRCDEKYVAVAELGKATDTLDATGSVILEKDFEHITRGDMEDKLKSFTGDIMQVPPLYSALKTQGQRLSVLLKQGHTVEAKPARPVTVYSLTLQDFKPPLFTLDIECGGGFYVRSLVDDLGKALLSCAHVKELIRTKQGPFILQEHVLHQHQWTLEHVLRSLHPCSDRGPPDHQRPTPEEHRDPEREGGAGLTG
ncbi:probable tRNA pseudouridine synthase 1 isoform X2 [Melanotaenia boesemani]|uniref:probable tRNA pseudouridine synthase 1 isoform X2 n=1 Tax=Melanotaenia boesemani TaxID=1250792 RepID=UPI001C03D6A2|nr:probable tRNA pseudouridine synthase 1 isoform X2 [Melanotaenia boesemani]